MEKKNKTVLITGGAGFIGFHLSKKLLDKGYRVVGFDNCNDYYDVSLKKDRLEILLQYDQYEFVFGNLANESAVMSLVSSVRPDVVVNLAAYAGVRHSIDTPRDYMESNVIGFYNVLEACRHYPVEHLVFASSSSVYGEQEKTPFTETDNTDHSVSFYAATKKTNEVMASTYSHLYGIPATGLRFFTVYGPYGRPDMAYFKFADAMRANKSITVYNHGEMFRDFTYIDDLVLSIEKIIDCPPHKNEHGDQYKVYNIGTGNPVKLMDFITNLEEAMGVTAQKEFLPMQAGDVHQTYADVTELERDFGYKPQTSVADGLTAFARWYKAYYQE